MAERHQQSELLRQRAFAVLAKGNIISNNHPLDYLEGDEGRDRMGIRMFSVVKISLAIVFHLECAELTKFQEFLKMVLSFKSPKRSRLFDTNEGRMYKNARLPPLHQMWKVRKKRARSAAWNLCYTNVFLLIKLMFTV